MKLQGLIGLHHGQHHDNALLMPLSIQWCQVRLVGQWPVACHDAWRRCCGLLTSRSCGGQPRKEPGAHQEAGALAICNGHLSTDLF